MRALFNLKFLTFLVCVFMFYPCLSKWEKFREYNVFIEYLDLGSVKKISNIIFVWSMIDYKEPQQNGNLSTKYYSKYDCNEKRFKNISIIEYKTSMGRGRNFKYKKNITNESTDSKWLYPSIDSPNYAKIKFICNIQ
ncbi:MAG: hypothetical protein CFH30_01265 [Alphaproteobacteria bacterium MarineAlpha8_Bin1]|nr:MAG: hypothetical protein CFH30_01265 [Alphaproteobacteria bacterium MarineAlpha8_Bin1]|tara:strand:+ start:219 stop:629 length:411 start_codon:yes stop_codon:yes gene_type:complete